MIIQGNFTGAFTLIDQLFRCLIDIANLAANNEISVQTARVILAALRPIYESLPGIIEFLRNSVGHATDSN